MASPRSKGPRGVQEIRTISGRVDRTAVASRAYLRVACLEMEKERRGRERVSAMARVRLVDARSLVIEAEKAVLLEALRLNAATGTADSRPAAGPLAARRPQGGFTIRY